MPDHPEEPPGYPTEWEADVLLTDGGVARLRPIRPSDAQLLVEFYDRVSPESKYLRFFAPYPRLSARDVARFTQVDYIDRVALIITLGEQMIGVGRYDRIEDDEAEVAFLVEDAHQGRGIAQLLLEHLAEAARERGITKFTAEVLPQNRAMAQVFADAGYRVSKGIEDGVLMVEFPILPTDTSVGVMERREHRAERASISRLLTPRAPRGARTRLAGAGTGRLHAARWLPRRGDRGQRRRRAGRRGAHGRLHRRRRGQDRPGPAGHPDQGPGRRRHRRRPQGCARPGRVDRHRLRRPRQRDDPGSGPRVRGAGHGTRRARFDQHRSGDRPERHAGQHAAAGRRRPVLPVGGRRRLAAQPRSTQRPGAVLVHQHGRLWPT